MSREPQRSADGLRPFRGGNYELSKPVKEGSEYDVTIETLGSKGDGIAKIQGFIIFVPNVKPGDHVKVKITSVRTNFATAEMVKASEKATESASTQEDESGKEE